MVKQYWKSQRGASSLGSGNSSSVTLLFGQAVQSIHTLAALSEYLPDAQFSHTDAPTFENVLASQSVHDDAAALEYLPASQFEHDKDLALEYLPAIQEIQLLGPGTKVPGNKLEALPASQSVHDNAPELEYVPAPQNVQSWFSAFENLPSGQSSQRASYDMTPAYLPAGHVVHDEDDSSASGKGAAC